MDNFTAIRPDSRLTPSQWETLLQSNAVSHWLSTDIETALGHGFRWDVITHAWPNTLKLRPGHLIRYVKLQFAHAPGMISRHRLQRKPRVSDPGMHHGTCVTHVPWCISGSLARGGGENIPGIPGACATLNFIYLARGHGWVTTSQLCMEIFTTACTGSCQNDKFWRSQWLKCHQKDIFQRYSNRQPSTLPIIQSAWHLNLRNGKVIRVIALVVTGNKGSHPDYLSVSMTFKLMAECGGAHP